MWQWLPTWVPLPCSASSAARSEGRSATESARQPDADAPILPAMRPIAPTDREARPNSSMSRTYPVPFTEVARRDRPRRLLIVGTAVLLVMALAAGAAWHPLMTVSARDTVTILGASAASLDPAVQADAGSAQVASQLFESLTAVDSSAQVQPA